MAKLYRNGNLQIPDDAEIERLGTPALESGAYERTFKDLFPHLPSPRDVVQGDMGNCGFMAAIMMLTHRPDGADCIQGMMKDVCFGRVVVRAYDNDNEPHYIQIPKASSAP